MSSSVTIPREMHAKMVKKLKKEYEAQFGSLNTIVEFALQEDWVAYYANVISFWKQRIPEIDMERRPNLKVICAHAIATNAERSMWSIVKKKGLEDEVKLKVTDLRSLD